MGRILRFIQIKSTETQNMSKYKSKNLYKFDALTITNFTIFDFLASLLWSVYLVAKIG